MEKVENKQEKIALAFNQDSFAERCRKGLVDDRGFYRAVEENADRNLRAFRESLTYVVR